MNSKHLKIIAIITMTLDHMGVYLFPGQPVIYLILRSVGRISYPIFAFLLAEGYRHTTNKLAYFTRLFVFAFVMEVFISGYAIYTKNWSMIFQENVLWPLVFGFVSMFLLEQKHFLAIIGFVGILVLAELLQIPYGAYGIGLICIFYHYRFIGLQVVFVFFYSIFFIDYPFLSLIGVSSEWIKYPSIQWWSMLSFIPLSFYNGLKGKMNKWFFYFYYPLHFVLLYLIKLIFWR